MELIRLIMLEQESGDTPEELKTYPKDLVVYNIAHMKDAGLLDADILPSKEGFPRGAAIIRLTWAGHTFLDASRDENVWRKAKEKILKPSASWTFGILTEWLKQEI